MARTPRPTHAPRAKRKEQSAHLLFALRSLPLAALALLIALVALPLVLASPRFAEVRKSPLSFTSYRNVLTSHSARRFAPLVGCTSNGLGGGPWNANTTWVIGCSGPGGIPAAGDDVTIKDNDTVIIDTELIPAVCNSLTVGEGTSGILQFDILLAGTLTVGTNVTIASGGTFQSATTGNVNTHSLSLGGNLTNNGTLDFSTSGNTAGAGITFTGASNNTFGGSGGTTDIRTLTINKGTSNANILELNPTNFTVQGVTTDVAGFLTLINGTFKLSGSFTGTNRIFTTSNYTIGSTSGFWLNNGNYSVAAQNATTTNGTTSSTGLLRISSGTYNVGTAPGNSFEYNSGFIFTMEGGAMNVAARFGNRTTTQTITFSMSGGILTLNTQGNASSSQGDFDIQATGSSFTMSGGTIAIQKASTAGTPIDYRNAANTVSITGGSVQFGNSATTGSPTFNVGVSAGSANTFPSLSVNASGTPSVKLNTAATVKGNLTIASGTTLNANSQSLTISGNSTTAGDWSNSGTFTSGTQTVTFNGTSQQQYAQSGSGNFSSLTLSNIAGLLLNNSPTVGGTLTLTSGDITTGNNTLVIASGGTVTHTSGHVIGNLQRTFAAAGSLTFDVGTANGYSPVAVNATAGSFPANFTTKAIQGSMPSISGTNKLARYWTLTNTTVTNANLTFAYLATDITGTVADYRFVKDSGGTLSVFAPNGTPTSTSASINGVTSFSDWTLAEPSAVPTDVGVSGGNLVITDGNGGTSNDMLTISLNGSNIHVTDSNNALSCGAGTTQVNENTCAVAVGEVNGIQVDTLAGDDTLTLDLSGGDFIPAGGLSFNGGDPTSGPGDKLIITGGSQGTVTYNYTNAHDGSIQMSNFGTVSYTGLEPITNSGTADDVIFNLPAGGTNDAILSDDDATGNTLSRLSSLGTFELTDFANPTGSLNINRGNAADTMTVNSLPDFNATLSIGTNSFPFATLTVSGTVSVTSTVGLRAGEVNGAGDISTGGGLTVNNTGTSSTLSGVISGAGSLSKVIGTGTLALSGANTYTGATTINAGRLNINGSITSNTTVNSGGTLGGTGTINSANTVTVNSGGTVSPGTSPGIVNTGQVTFNSGSTYAVEINGTTTGTGYDQLNVTGLVTLGGATLNLSGTHTPVIGNTFIIVNNDSTDAITGTFTMGTGGTDANGAPLAEGDTITNFLGSSLSATITYVGNGSSGNDVGLTVVEASADLSITKTDSPDPVTVGNALTYTLTVSNAGPANATNVVVTDTLPGSVTFVSATPSQGSACTGITTITCNLGTINNSGNATVTIIVIPNAPGTITNNASATATESDATPAADGEDTLVVAGTCTTPPAGMVAWLPGDGNSHDISGNGNNGAVSGPIFSPGKVSSAFDFDSVDDNLVVPSSASLNSTTTAVTVDAWVYWRGHAPADTTDRIHAKRGTSPALSASHHMVIVNSTLHFGVDIGAGGNNASSPNFPMNRWVHVAGTYDSSSPTPTVRLFIDGVEAASQAVSSGPIDFENGDLAIGWFDPTFGEHFNGLIDEFEIFDSALSAPDIASLHNASFAGKCRTCTTPPANMVSWYPAEGNANDIAGPNDGTFAGNTYATGKVGQAFSLDGVDDDVNLGDLDLPSMFTFDAWINLGSISNSPFVIAKTDGAGEESYAISVASTGKLVAQVRNASDSLTRYRTTNSVIPTGAWHHIAVTYDGAAGANQKFKFYVNGVEEPAAADSTFDFGGVPRSNAVATRIGSSAGFFPLNGLVDETELFGRVLSASEIAALANAGNAGKCHTSIVNVTVAPASVAEDGSTDLVYTFSRDVNTAGTATVNFSIGGSASFSGGDYDQTGATTFDSPSGQGTVSFDAGDSVKTVTINPTPDGTDEPDETVILTVTSGAGYVVGSPDTATGTIANDDATLTLVKTVINNNGGTTVVSDFPLFIDGAPVTSGTPATVSANVVHTASETGQTGYSASVWAGDCNADGTITLQPGDNKTCTITNDDIAPAISIDDVTHLEGDSGTTDYNFTVNLSHPSSLTITVNAQTADGTATTADSDYNGVPSTLLTFAPTVTTQEFHVTVNGDTKFSIDETFFVNLSSPSNATISDNQGIGTLSNDDASPTLSIGNATKFEGTTVGTTTSFDFTVTKSGTATEVNATVSYATVPGTANENPAAACGGTFDYQFKSDSLTFAPLETTKAITILVCKDSTFEADETFFVNLSGETNVTVTDNQGLGTIANDDAAPPLSSVNTTDDANDGSCDATHCSLREAINAANASSGSVSIVFAIPFNDPRHFYYTDDGVAGQVSLANITTTSAVNDSGLVTPDPDWAHSWWSILPASALPALNTTAVGATIDGYSQSGASPNTAAAGHNAVLRIELNGSGISAGVTHGLTIGSGSNTVSGLIINRFLGTGGAGTGNGVGMTSSSDALKGNFIGTDPSGTIDVGNAGSGVVATVSNVNIGGANVGDANLISGNDGSGIALTGNSVVVQGNYIGTKADGTSALGNALNGVAFSGGGAVFNTIGGTGAGEANLIAFSGQHGVNAGGGFSNSIRGNSIFSNGATIGHLGIDLGADGVTANDGDDLGTPAVDPDSDTGPNNLQNFPIITQALAGAPDPMKGTLNSQPNQTYTIDVYASPSCDASGNGEGKKYFGSTTADTDANGDAVWSLDPTTLNSGDFITATATDSLGNTSEFSPCFQATAFNPGTLQFVNAPYSDGETNTDHTVTITVSRTGGSDLALDVTYQTSDGTATAGEDYVAASGTLHWNNGETGDKTFTTTVKGDTIFEGDETVNITLSGATISGANPTTLTITNDDSQPSLSIDNVSLAEGNSGTTNFVFTVTKTSVGPVSVNYQTQNGTATIANSDYQTSNGSLSFGAFETQKMITVLVNGDAAPDLDETFSVVLSGASGATIGDDTGVGTILNDDESVSAGELIISEFRLSGPGANPTENANNEFIELYNSTDQDLFVTTTDGSAGWAVATSSGVQVFYIPNGITIPARGHYLGTNTSGYSLNNYAAGEVTFATGNAAWTTDVPDNTALAVFRTNNAANFNTTNRLDSVGPNTETNPLYKEGAGYSPLAPADLTQNLEHTFFRQICVFQAGCSTPGRPRDTQDNAADFIFADTTGAATSAGQRLGSPGPENLSSPIKRDPAVNLVLLDASVVDGSAPNRDRNTTSDSANASSFGTMTIRRRVVNQTGGAVTRLRFRVIDLTTHLSGALADLRLRSSSDETVVSVNDSNSCGVELLSPLCTLTVKGLTLEQPPNHLAINGAGMNSTLNVVLPEGGLLNGQSINVNFLLGVQKTGQFRFYLVIEALP